MYLSEHFGRAFWVDSNNEFRSCPLKVNNKPDYSQADYVSEWTDWEGVNMDKLFGIYRTMAAQFHYDEILKLKEINLNSSKSEKVNSDIQEKINKLKNISEKKSSYFRYYRSRWLLFSRTFIKKKIHCAWG